ncbi:MAG: amino acid permease [Saprospiraceae bacterium]|uniref:Amino acid permease n=1 Tax=Candidatus Opimibacter skivensis TaxID=2982028 RepID=A0A9D7STF3_9BACT|nr:amino acid permease [Candidatus Opimibacter skivensis]
MKLKESFGLWACVSIVIGSIIGSGIFMKPASMAAQLGSPQLLIAVWIGAGIITLFGALSNAEVATMFPQTGGQYVFFQKMYGDFIAFLYGWAAFAVFNTAGIASIAYVLGTYVEYFVHLPRFSMELEKSIDLFIPFIGHIFPLENIGVKGVTIFVVVLLSYVNSRSSKLGGNLGVIITILKIAAIGLIVIGLIFSGDGHSSNFFQHSTSINPQGWALLGAIVAATSGAFWGYDGWNNIGFVAGEVKNPQRNIPKSLLIGVLLCILIYVLINLAFLYMLPIDTMATSSMVASDAMKIAFGSIGGGIIALIVILSTFGTTHSNVLATARVTYAMAADGQFFKSLGRVHPKYTTPSNAIWIQGIWTSLLVLSGSFDTLTDMLIFVSYLFYGMSAFGLFVLRRKLPEANRPYKVWGYPIVPGVFVLFTLFFLTITLFNDVNNYIAGRSIIINSLFGILLTCIGIPLYWYFTLSKKKAQVL